MKTLLQSRFTVACGLFLVLILLIAALAPLVAPFSYEIQDINRVLLPPNSINWFGTDGLGRDLFSRVIYGARVSMTVGLLTSLIAIAVGAAYGSIAGFYGGRTDSVMMRIVDVFQAFPHLVLLILVSVVLSPLRLFSNEELRSVFAITFALSLIGWVNVARLVRNQVLQVKEMPFVEAGLAAGAGTARVLVRHIFPNIIGPVIVMFTYMVPSQILFESFLSFLGLGLQPPYSSWGVLANEGWRSFRAYPHLIIFPGLAIFLTMLACQFFGDGLRDALDPQARYQ